MAHTIPLTPAVLRTLSRPEPPPGLHDRIAAAIRAEAARQQWRHRLRRCAAIGLMVALALIVVLYGGVR